MTTPFADSITPSLIPPAFTHVAAYANGRYAWPEIEIDRFPRHVMIGVEPGNPSQAAVARCLDVERFDARPADFPPFAEERTRLGHEDPTAYTSILGPEGFGLAPLLVAISNAQYKGPVRYWIAWWWGRPFPPTATEVLAEIKTLTNISLPASQLWACQWQNGQNYDSSVLYQRDDFTR